MGTTGIKYDDLCDKCAHGEYCDMATFSDHNMKILACCKFTKRHQTNADRIRTMTDEKLASELCALLAVCATCPGYELCDPNDGGANGLIKWLKQETEEGE